MLKLHLFNKKYSKSYNIVKYCNFNKNIFFIII